MRNLFFILLAGVLLLSSNSFSQNIGISDSAKAAIEQQIKLINEKIKEKNYKWKAGITSLSYLSKEEMKALCGLLLDESELPKILQKEDSLYKDFETQKKSGLLKTLSLPNWIGDMNYIENQECGNCWAHAATGVTEGLLHKYNGSNIQIDLYEMDVTNNASCGSCSGTYYLDCGLSYIYESKVKCEPGINQFPNYDHTYYTVSSYSNNTASISAIKSSLESSPVLAGMVVYSDFFYYSGGIYRHVSGGWAGNHAVVIVGYNDDEEYWVCKNSWGTGWGEREDGQSDPYPDKGYFRIAYGECGIDAMGNVTATVQSNSFAKIIPNFQSFTTAMNASWLDNEWAYVQSNVTIGSGVSVTVPAGAYIAFENGSSLIVNGTLTAHGIIDVETIPIIFDFVSPSSQNGLKFNSGSSGTLWFCTIKNAHYGIYCNHSLPNIIMCTITNNHWGIYIYNAGIQTHDVGNNTIEDNSYVGIDIGYSSPRNIYGNKIRDNGQAGIYCTNSNPYLYNNEITNNGAAGITCALYSAACLGYNYRYPGYNLITGNYWGVGCGYESDVIIGASTAAGYNSIHDNTSYEVTAEYGSIVMAENNWWNRTPPAYPNYYYSGDFLASYGGSVDYIPALTYDPVGGMMILSSNSVVESNSNLQEADDSDSFFDSELREALDNLMDGEYEVAIKMYEQRFKKETDKSKKKYILRRIAECYNLSGKEGFIYFLNNEVRPSLSQNDDVYATTLVLENIFLIGEKKYNQAINNFVQIKTDFSNNEAIVKAALYNLIYLYYNQFNDVNKGKDYLTELKSLFPNDDLTINAMILAGEFENVFSQKPKLGKEVTVKIESPDKYALLGNFPNPFNPSTNIRYILPFQSSVELNIYDIMGREVKSFIIPSQSQGNQNITWNGTNESGNLVSSGIYVYTIKIRSLENGKIFLKSSKLMMMK